MIIGIVSNMNNKTRFRGRVVKLHAIYQIYVSLDHKIQIWHQTCNLTYWRLNEAAGGHSKTVLEVI